MQTNNTTSANCPLISQEEIITGNSPMGVATEFIKRARQSFGAIVISIVCIASQGAGKTFFATHLEEECSKDALLKHYRHEECSADEYMGDKFILARLGDCHEKCRTKYDTVCQDAKDKETLTVVTVHNTHTTEWERLPYMQPIYKDGRCVSATLLLFFVPPEGVSLTTCALVQKARCQHAGVTASVMYDKLEFTTRNTNRAKAHKNLRNVYVGEATIPMAGDEIEAAKAEQANFDPPRFSVQPTDRRVRFTAQLMNKRTLLKLSPNAGTLEDMNENCKQHGLTPVGQPGLTVKFNAGKKLAEEFENLFMQPDSPTVTGYMDYEVIHTFQFNDTVGYWPIRIECATAEQTAFLEKYAAKHVTWGTKNAQPLKAKTSHDKLRKQGILPC